MICHVSQVSSKWVRKGFLYAWGYVSGRVLIQQWMFWRNSGGFHLKILSRIFQEAAQIHLNYFFTILFLKSLKLANFL